MAEKIDKNEYVDNSKVFFDFLLHTHQWSNITPVEYAKWLSNFNDIPDGQYIACRLLNRFLYYSDKDIKKLLVDAINDVYSQQVVLPLQLSKDFSSLPSENEYEINEAIKRTLFIPLTPWGDPGASGLYIMRCIHNYYKPRVQSCHVSEVIDSMSAPYDRIVIVDDFVGSGEQFADFWETAEIKDGTLLRDWCCSHQIQANSVNEIIQPTHDYKYFKFENLLETAEYKNTLKSICEKRFTMFFDQLEQRPECSTDIEFYLGNYSIDCELARFENRTLKFKESLERIIWTLSKDEEEFQYYYDTLCNEAPLLNARMHQALLLRSSNYRPTLSELTSCFLDWKYNRKTPKKKKYDEWLHTTKTGIVFLLAKESGLEKWYYGFDTYVMLSSGIVRYFLELCEQAFNFAIMNGFGWEQPSPLSPEIQTKAARFVSRYKVEETSSFPLYGSNLRIFIQCLGQIFKELHRNERLTLGEPEPNHFTMDALDSLDHRDVLDCAITCSALQELPQTKGKEALNTHVLDYHLNKIYTPYFEISYFKKRKILFQDFPCSDDPRNGCSKQVKRGNRSFPWLRW